MTNLYLHTLTCLGLIRGPAVDQWMDAYLQEPVNRVTMHHRNPNHVLVINPAEEQVWNDFETAF
jgi:hypothetical protein